MLNRFARIPGKRRTTPRLFTVGHHQPFTTAPESLLNSTVSAPKSEGGFPTLIGTGAASAHPIANGTTMQIIKRIAARANSHFMFT